MDSPTNYNSFIADIIWFAGILDGEGSLGINKIIAKAPGAFVPKRGFAWRICGKIANTNESLMDKVARICGKNAYRYFRSSKRPQEKDVFYIDIKPNALRRLLPYCLPYLTAKMRHAEILIEALTLCSYYTRQWRGEKSLQREKKLEELYQEIKKLNKRGR